MADSSNKKLEENVTSLRLLILPLIRTFLVRILLVELLMLQSKNLPKRKINTITDTHSKLKETNISTKISWRVSK